MKFTKLLILATALVGMLSFTSCTRSERAFVTGAVAGSVVTHAANNYNNNRSYRNGSDNYRMGYRHGCKTATDRYTQNSYRFDRYDDYRRGWHQGRRDCR